MSHSEFMDYGKSDFPLEADSSRSNPKLWQAAADPEQAARWYGIGRR